MVRPDERTLRALHRIKVDPDLKPISEWLVACTEAQQTKNDHTASDITLRWGQGKAQLLSELVKTIDTARATAEKIIA